MGKLLREAHRRRRLSRRKKALVAESDDEEDNSDGEVDMKSIIKFLTMITREYNREFRRPYYRGQYEREDRGEVLRRK